MQIKIFSNRYKNWYIAKDINGNRYIKFNNIKHQIFKVMDYKSKFYGFFIADKTCFLLPFNL